MLPTRAELVERYSSYTNNRLLLILHNRRQYTHEASEVARAELARRKITPRDIDRFLDEREERMAKQLSITPLTIWEKAFFFFLWFAPMFLFGPIVPGGTFRMNYSEDALQMKSRQSERFAIAGFISLMADLFVAVHFKVEVVLCVLLLPLFFVLFVWSEKRFDESGEV